MSPVSLIILLVIASICGSIGSALAGYSHIGCLSSIALGFLGAWVGMWFASQLHLPPLYSVHVGGHAFPVVWAVIGAALFSAVMSALTKRNPYGF